MKKTYIIPTTEVFEVKTQQHILTGSGGVANNSPLGDEYLEPDVSY